MKICLMRYVETEFYKREISSAISCFHVTVRYCNVFGRVFVRAQNSGSMGQGSGGTGSASGRHAVRQAFNCTLYP